MIAPTASCVAAWMLRRALLLALFGGLLVACEAENQDLQAWMALQHREAKPRVQPLAAPKKFEPVPYANAGQVDPFSSQKLNVAIKQQEGQPNSLLASEANRRKQPLEALPLDERLAVWDLVKADRDGEILLEVSDAVRETLIAHMETKELVAATEQLDTDEIADLAPDLPREVMQDVFRSLSVEERDQLRELRLEEIRQQVQKGIDSGESTPLDMEEIKARGRERLASA